MLSVESSTTTTGRLATTNCSRWIIPGDPTQSIDSLQLSRFNSRYFYPGTSGVDAFSFHWARENNWLCPPVSQIVAVIRHVQTCQAQGTLLVPEWPSSYFWPTLFKDGIHFGRGLTNWIRISNPTFIPSRLEGKSVFNGETHFNMLALRLDFPPDFSSSADFTWTI